MGNTPSTHTQSSLHCLGQSYQQIKKDNRGLVLLHKQTDITYLLKQFVYPTQSTFKNKLKNIQEQISQPQRQFIINPIKVEYQVFNNFCSTSYKIYVLYQYPQVTLKQEITARKKQDKNFEQAQLWSIVQSCTNALSQLKPYISLNPNEIYINPDGNLKIIHDDLVQQNYRAIISNNIYYAPQKLRNFNKQDSQLSMRKQSIFSMGMTILQAALLQDISSCYNYNQVSFDQQQLSALISNLQDRYSVEFIDMLINILQVNPNRRASLMEIQNNLDRYWSYEKQDEQVNKSKMTFQNNGNTQGNQQVLGQKINQKVNHNAHNYDMQTNKQLTFNNSKKYITYEQSAVQTPKNLPTNTNKQNNSLYTDPKLFQMIRKDLQQINKLKKSTLYQTSRYTFMYPQTQNILNSIKNMNNNITSSANRQNKHDLSSYNNSQRVSFQKNYKISQVQGHQQRQVQAHRQQYGNSYKYNEYGQQQYKMKEPRKSQTYINRVQNVQDNHYNNRNMKKNNKENLIYVIQTYQNGSKYQGTALNGLKHGYGKLTFQDGVYYQGYFQQDKMNGKGVLYYSINQIAYDGQWTNDQFDGYGILYNQNPVSLDEMYDYSDFNNIDDYWIKYQGNFVLDNKCGEGKLYLTNGQILDGVFKEDYVDGHCRFNRVNGQIIEGYWQINMLRQEINEF